MTLIIDSYAWIELLAGTPSAAKVARALEEADVTVTPDIVLAEVGRKLARDG